MELKRIPVRVDIVKPHQGEMMQVVSGDNEGNLFEINLTMNGRPYNIGNNIVQIVFKKPDGTKVTQSTEDIELPITTNGNKIYCILKSGTISAKGKVQAEIQITDGTKLITSAQFYFAVRLPIIDDETVESTNELSLLVAAVQAEAERKTAELQREQNENARQELKAQLDSMKATLQGWLDDPEQFRGPKGEQGEQGERGETGPQGEPGQKGDPGLSAYEVWLAQGNAGTEADYLASLKGDKGDPGEVTQAEFQSHLNDYATYKDSNSLKVAKVEKELNDYQQTMASINVNQEAKQTASGYGVVSLPKNAANGQVSATIKGNTETDEESNTKSTVSAMRLKSVGKNLLLLKSKKILDNLPYTPPSQSQQYFRDYDIIIGATRNGYISSGSVEIYEFTENKLDIMTKSSGYGVGIKFKAQAGEVYVKSDNVYGIGLFDKDGNNLVFTAGSMKNITAPANTAFGFAIITTEQNVRQVIENLQVERGNTATPYEPYTESTQYITAKDEEGNIAELRSLPNGVKDEIRVSEGKLIKRVSDEVAITQYMVISLNTNPEWYDGVTVQLPNDILNTPNLRDKYLVYGWGISPSFAQGNEDDIGTVAPFDSANRIVAFKVAKGTYNNISEARADLAGTKLTYQLAEPVEIPIQVSGTLLSNPSGTVYVEPVVADAGIYDEGMAVLHEDLPIKAIEKVSKVDFTTGLETELDIEGIEISTDRLSFTHPELEDGDIVFFTYFYDKEGTLGETTIEYYDSRYVLKDDVTGKFYKVVPKVSNGELINDLVEV